MGRHRSHRRSSITRLTFAGDGDTVLALCGVAGYITSIAEFEARAGPELWRRSVGSNEAGDFDSAGGAVVLGRLAMQGRGYWCEIRLVELGEDRERLLLQTDDFVTHGLAVSVDGRVAIAGAKVAPPRQTFVWELGPDNEGLGPPRAADVLCLAYSQGGERLAAGGQDGVHVWESGRCIARHPIPATHMVWCRDGTLLGGGDGKLWYVETDAATPRPLDLALPSPLALWTADATGRLLAVAARDGSIFVLDRAGGSKTRVAQRAVPGVSCLAFDDAGTRIAAGTDAGGVVVWDVVR
jgi:hypothetical protein